MYNKQDGDVELVIHTGSCCTGADSRDETAKLRLAFMRKIPRNQLTGNTSKSAKLVAQIVPSCQNIARKGYQISCAERGKSTTTPAWHLPE